MASPGGEPEAMLARTTVVSLALQALVGRLVSNGTLSRADLLAMRKAGLQLAADRLRGEMAAWWDVTDAMADV